MIGIVLEPEIIIREMPWKCLDCRVVFPGPCDRKPKDGCPECGSQRIIDCNATPFRKGLYP